MQMKKWEAAGVVAERDSFDIDSAKPTRPPNVRYRDDATSPSGPLAPVRRQATVGQDRS